MFTGNSIDLKTATQGLLMEVQRDCTLSYVGKVPSQLPRRFVPCGAPQHIEAALEFTDIAGIVTSPEHAHLVPEELGLALADDPVKAAYELHEALCDLPDFLWKDFDSRIAPDAHIHPSAWVAQKNVIIGPNSRISAQACVAERVVIGAHCSIGSGTVVGADAFEVNTRVSPQRILKAAGGVRLGDHVDIQSGCTLVRATFGSFTTVGDECKFDCQVHLAHDCFLGARVHAAACAEISGRVEIGDDVFLGPNCSIVNGLKIGARAHITIGAVVVRNVPADARVSGNFALPHSKWINFIKSIR